MRNCRQQTVYVAVTRRMAPSAHILAYFVDYTGELVADVIHFHVNITSDAVALNLTINQRKDLTGDTVELLAYGPPQARVAFAGTEYAQYQLYGGNDLLEMDVCNQNLITQTDSKMIFQGEKRNEYIRGLNRPSDLCMEQVPTIIFAFVTGLAKLLLCYINYSLILIIPFFIFILL
jgi:hypothetical protein